MPYIVRNQIKYATGSGSGGGNTNSVDLTMAEYEALEEQGKVSEDTTYYITDASVEGMFSSGIVKLTQEEYDALPESKYSDGVLYAITDGENSGSVGKPVELTREQYEALGDSVLNDNILYAITDGDDLTAKNLAFDDSETQLGVNNVQDAIVEQNKNKANKINRYYFDSLSTDAYGEIYLGHFFNQDDIILYATSDSGARLTVYSALGRFILKAVDQLNGAIANTEIFGVSVYYMKFI